MNKEYKTMQQKMMYVWRLDQTDVGMVTTASTQLKASDYPRLWAVEGKESSPEYWQFIKYLNAEYLTESRGDICISAYPSYEACMSHFQGMEVSVEHHEAPTEH